MIDPYREYKNARGGDTRIHNVYGVATDSHNNAYAMDQRGEFIAKVDAKTGKVTLYSTPTRDSGPRLGWMDAQDRLWFAENRVNNIAMLDTKTG